MAGQYIAEENLKPPPDGRVVIVAAKFNKQIVDRLLEGAVSTLEQHGLGGGRVQVVRCPGAWEIPVLVQKACEAKDVRAVIALGSVIRGETPHFDMIAEQAARGCSTVMLQARKPVVFGVLTTNDEQQALDRAGGKEGNKGSEAAQVAMEMIIGMDELTKGQ